MPEVHHTYFLLFLDAEDGGTWGGMAAASLRGLPRGRLSAWARLSVDVAPTPLEDGEGPWSEGSTVLSSDDILKTKQRKLQWLRYHIQNYNMKVASSAEMN